MGGLLGWNLGVPTASALAIPVGLIVCGGGGSVKTTPTAPQSSAAFRVHEAVLLPLPMASTTLAGCPALGLELLCSSVKAPPPEVMLVAVARSAVTTAA